MARIRTGLGWFAFLQAVTAGILCSGSTLLAAENGTAQEKGSKDSIQQKWHDGLAALGSGRFQDAFNLIHDVAQKKSGNDEQVSHVESWVTDFEKIQKERGERARQDYDQYVSWVKDDSEKEHWQAAIRSASMAFNTVQDQDAFRKEPWLIKVVSGANGAAREYEEHGKWLQAARIYVRLMDIFPHNKEYKNSLDRCQSHLRLDFTYSKDSDWEAAVANITPDMAKEAFRKIETEYVTEPNFKDAAVAALKHLLLMTEEKKLAKIFSPLDNKELVGEFRDRVEARLKSVNDADDIGAQELTNQFDRVLRINRETKLFPQNVLIHEFVYGALRPLDPFSDMLWPAEMSEFNKHTQGHFSGVGISIHKDPGEPLKVVSPLEDSPAYKAGIQAGDLITGINGQPSRKFTITSAVREITGPAGTSVTLTIKRPGVEKEFDVKLERQDITIYTIKGFERDETGRWKYMIDPVNKIGFVRMTNFTENTIDELKDVIVKLRKQEGLRGLIFDLRGNPGGPLKAAVDVSDLFLDGHKKIVATKDRHEKEWSQATSSDPDGHFSDFPMIILVNGSSASASEIVSGALQVHQRALIVGERSFGKGSVQQVMRLNGNQAYLKLTTAHYYLPNGRCLHREEDSTSWGVDPDVEVKLIPKEYVKVMELHLNNEVLKGKDQKNFTKDYVKSITAITPATKPAHDKDGAKDASDEDGLDEDEDDPADVQREDPNKYPEMDPQLDAALMLMRVRITSEQPWPLKGGAEVAAAKPADASSR